jgi:hypothetical protein
MYERLFRTSPTAPQKGPALPDPRDASSLPVLWPVALLHRLSAMPPEPMPFQRQVSWDSSKGALVKVKREAFTSETQTQMGLNSGEARCHFIPYEQIVTAVMDPINDCIANGWNDTALGALDGLVNAIFPNGATAANHKTQPNTLALDALAAKYYALATAAVNTIENAIKSKNASALEAAAKQLVTSLNNSPDNLRPGWSGTNSSIQSGLDFIQNTAASTLPLAAIIVDVNGKPTGTPLPAKVIRVDAQHEKPLKTLLTTTYDKSGVVHAFSSGPSVQSSENKGQKSDTMDISNPTPIAILWGLSHGKPLYFLFDL